MAMLQMMGASTVPCGAPRTEVLGKDASLSMRTTAPVPLRNSADQRTMWLGIDSRRISKMIFSWYTVSRALAWPTKSVVVRCFGALRCMAALRCGNWSRVELPGHKPDRCGVNWGSMTSRMRATRIRSMSLLRQLVIIAGRWGVAVGCRFSRIAEERYDDHTSSIPWDGPRT
ncbi:hypothetical protein TcG_08599 [Trypanosoma cruzi]|nr:hypothetical protein TcG_08599 [Trypanosoma cruzi]